MFKALKTFTLNYDLRTSLAKIKVAKIKVAKFLHFQKIANQTHDGFNDASKITKTLLNEAQNVLARVSMLEIISTLTL